MKTPGTTTTATAPHSVAPDAPEQLALLVTPAIPVQFRLDEDTRRSGLQHVAQLRAQMVAQAAARAASSPRRTRGKAVATVNTNRRIAA
jgi:hypothetical protein